MFQQLIKKITSSVPWIGPLCKAIVLEPAQKTWIHSAASTRGGRQERHSSHWFLHTRWLHHHADCAKHLLSFALVATTHTKQLVWLLFKANVLVTTQKNWIHIVQPACCGHEKCH